MSNPPSSAAELPPQTAVEQARVNLHPHPPTAKLHALTSMRFFAAILIVCYHAAGRFSLGDALPKNVLLDQCVSFFFVLSGFILCYVYPSLPAKNVPKFLVARVARIWPAHIAAIIALFMLISQTMQAYHHETAILAVNVLMVQTWFPVAGQFVSLNSPSWSIATEFAFYLMFPLLLWKFDRTWHVKLIVMFGLVVGVLWMYNLEHPPFGLPAHPDMGYEHPLARALEFTLGMTAALAWRKLKPRTAPAGGAGAPSRPTLGYTLLEIAAFTLAIAAFWKAVPWASELAASWHLSYAWACYLAHGGIACIPFAILILVLAFNRGLLARGLAIWPLVLLGEISYSIYLLHFIYLSYYSIHVHAFRFIHPHVAAALYVSFTLLASHLTWMLIERPARESLLALYSRLTRAKVKKPPRPDRLMWPGWKIVIPEIALFLAFSAGVFYCVHVRPAYDTLTPTQAVAFAQSCPEPLRDIHFSPGYTLLALRLDRDEQGLMIRAVWRADADLVLNRTVAVHIDDAAGKRLAQADYAQDPDHHKIRKGTLWQENTRIPTEKLKNATTLGLALYGPAGFCTIDKGTRDWDNHRLLINLGR